MKPRKQPTWDRDARRGWLVASDYRRIFALMNQHSVPPGRAQKLARKYRVSVGTVFAIARGVTGRRYLGTSVQPLAAGLRSFLPKNRHRAAASRGIERQTFLYSWLRPKTEKPTKKRVRATVTPIRATADRKVNK